MSLQGTELSTAVLAAVFSVALGASAQAATITSGAQSSYGFGLDLSGATPCGNSGALSTNVGSFTGAGKAGSGGAVCGDRTTEQVKTEASKRLFGRYSPTGESWIDSNDLKHVTWDVDIKRPFSAVSFALVDAHDQADSHFSIEADGATWTLPERQSNGNLQWISILFDAPVDSAEIVFRTRHNDGYGVSDISVAPVPVPAAGLLALTGLMVLGAVRIGRRRRRGLTGPL
jgi:hypothetical protein